MSERCLTVNCGIRGALSVTDVSDAELLERFVASRDEAAFAALMARHGPMVFGVCRRLLHHTLDAEDAFQATFLVLVRKAANIGKRELLGNWLYGVALRVAVRARDLAAKRRAREAAHMERIAVATHEPSETSDLSTAVTEEVQKLPGKYRVPVVLYYLEGRTSEEVANEIHCPVGTIKTRLSRAREMLRKRLTRRGLALSTAAFSTALSSQALAAPLPLALIDSTLKAAMSFAAGNAAAGGLVSTQVAALTKGVLHTMFVSKMKTVVVLALALIVSGAGGFAYYVLATTADVKKTDKENIQGTWKVESVTMNGRDPEDGNGAWIKKSTVEITADKMLAKFNDETREYTYKLDSVVKPKTIDITHQGNDADGIYKLEGNTLTICIPCGGRMERPTEFVSKEDSNTALIVLKRVKR